MSLKTHSFEFGEFFLDTREKVLFFDKKPLPITPKAFEMLQLLIENHDHLVEKTELMNKIWEDSFVEEGNVAFTIWQLRKILEDDRHNPRFIETVPKRGYRFIGKVRKIANQDETLSEISFQTFRNDKQNLIQRDFLNRTFEPKERQIQSKNPQFDGKTPSINFQKSLFGRENQIKKIAELLENEAVGLISLTGIGGSGKTTLAKVIAEICKNDFQDGIFFIDLSAVFDPDFVVPAIAHTLDVKESGSKSLLETLQTFLNKRKILLIVDNFEQVISAAPIFSKILSNASSLKILVTSRATLRLSIENEVVIPPLEVPPLGNSKKQLSEITDFPSVQMFFERARSAKSNFQLNDENASDIAEICSYLEGLPLSIELAAARIKLLKPSAILQRLENRLQLLTSGSVDLPKRQQTLRDTIAWSFDLLEEPEKKLFRRLAVFAGGFNAETAEIVCESENGGMAILDGLETLLTNNLIRLADNSADEIRLSMLETIREFASEKLSENTAEETFIRQRHAEYFLNFAKKIEREVVGVNQVFLLDQMESERSNFRTAMKWFQKTAGENELKLAASLAPLWTFRGYLSEGIERLTEVSEKNPNASPAIRAKALAWLGQLIWVKGDYVKAIRICEEALELAERINYPIIAALAYFVLGMSHWYQFNDAETAICNLEKGLSLYKKLEFDSGIVFILVVIAAISQSKGDLVKAEELLKESLKAAEKTGNNLALSIAKVNYGRLEIAKGNLAIAKNLCRDSLKLRGEISDRWGLVQCLEPLTNIALKENNPHYAAKMLGAIAVLLESLGASPPLILRADHEPNISLARQMLDTTTFEKLFNTGRKLSLDEVVELALNDETATPNFQANKPQQTRNFKPNVSENDFNSKKFGIIAASLLIFLLLIAVFYFLMN